MQKKKLHINFIQDFFSHFLHLYYIENIYSAKKSNVNRFKM